MKFSDVGKHDPWMTAEEQKYMKRFASIMRGFLTAHGVQESPLVCLRVHDVGVHCLVARRLESAMKSFPEEGNGVPEIAGSLADHIGKARERLRKAIRELEDACARLGTPVDVGLADKLAPVIRETRELIHGVQPSAGAAAGTDGASVGQAARDARRSRLANPGAGGDEG